MDRSAARPTGDADDTGTGSVSDAASATGAGSVTDTASVTGATNLERAGRVRGAGSAEGARDAEGVEPALDLAAAQAIIAAQRDRARDTMVPDGRVIFLVWAVSWLLGYGLMWATSRDGGLPPGWAGAIFGLLILAAVAATVIHTVRRSSGLAGPSRAVGQMYGWSWFVAFLAGQAMVGALGQARVSDEVVLLAANAVSALIVGILYMAGGALWQDRSQFALGVWMALVAAVAAFAGLPGTYAVMGLAGGGGFLVGALVEHVARLRGTGTRRRGRV